MGEGIVWDELVEGEDVCMCVCVCVLKKGAHSFRWERYRYCWKERLQTCCVFVMLFVWWSAECGSRCATFCGGHALIDKGDWGAEVWGPCTLDPHVLY